MSARVAAVVPVIDEQEAIGEVVEGLRRSGACCVFVVDGGSSDGTAEVAAAVGAIVVVEPRRGYGRACLTGGARAVDSDPHPHDTVVFLDGDGSCDGADLAALVAALATADVALGRRPTELIAPGAMPWHARLGNHLVALVVSVRTGRRVRDLPPAKALRASALERLRLDEAGYGWTVQLVARALADPTLRVREVPVAFRRRHGGTSKVSGSPRASVGAGLAMLRVAVQATRPRPLIGLMAKAPRAGHAKTRLAAGLGADRTADLWAACLADGGANLVDAATMGRCDLVVMLAEASDVAPMMQILGHVWTPLVQRRSGLAAALAEVFLAAFDRGADRAIAVAGDVPSLPPAYAIDALERLEGGRSSSVFGPSADGGYHLVGLGWRGAPRWWPRVARQRRRAHLARRLELAFNVPMGGASALEATRSGMIAAGWVPEDLAPWMDLDTVDDLRALVTELDGDGRFAPSTTAWVTRHRDVIGEPLNTTLSMKEDLS